MEEATPPAASDEVETSATAETRSTAHVELSEEPAGLPNMVSEEEERPTPPASPPRTPTPPPPIMRPVAPRPCPRGLENLKSLDRFFIQQQTELLETFTGFETKNMYDIKDKYGTTILYAAEETCCCVRNCWGTLRAFEMGLFNSLNQELVHIRRPNRADCCILPCCLQRAYVTTPNELPIGVVKQKWRLLGPKFAVCDPDGNEVLYIRGPRCTFTCCGNVDFPIYATDRATIVGRISQDWTDVDQQFVPQSDYYGVSFPIDLDVHLKISIIAACFLIDFLYFSHSNNDTKAIKAERNECPSPVSHSQ